MRIGVVGSMHYTERMLDIRDKLKKLGHDAFISNFSDSFVGKSDDDKETIKQDQKRNQDAIRDFWRKMQGADAILVANFDRHGVKNYIGGNTLMEIGFAHVLDQKIFLLNPVPDIPYYKTEIEAVNPVILKGDLTKVK